MGGCRACGSGVGGLAMSDLVERALWLASGQDDLHSQTIVELTTRILELEQSLQRKQGLFEALVSFVHRWTWDKVGNGTTDAERLDAIKHYPPIAHRALPVVAPTTAVQP